MTTTKKYPAEIYAEQVRDGRILVCEYVRLAVRRYYADLDRALERGWHFDRRAALRAIGFIERLKHTKGEWAGRRFRLEPWQHFVLWNIFGWKNADGTRRFRYAYIEIARKNGKTALSAGVGLYMLFADGESRPEVYSAATVKDQAKICFADAVEIVRATDLKHYLTPFRNSIVYEARGGMMKPLSSDYGTHDGLNPSCGIIDEFHAHRDSGMFDVIKSAFGARRQPLMFIITTAGFNKSGACYAYRENVIKVLREVNEDDTLFGIIYTLDTNEEWDDPRMWIKSNPNLGVSLSADYLADQVRDARNRPEAVRNVMTKNLNLWVDAERTWILDDTWQKCVGTTRPTNCAAAPAGVGSISRTSPTSRPMYFCFTKTTAFNSCHTSGYPRSGCSKRSAARISTTTAGWPADTSPSRPATSSTTTLSRPTSSAGQLTMTCARRHTTAGTPRRRL